MGLFSEPDYDSYSPSRARFVKKWTSRLVAMGELIDGYDLLVIGVAMLSLQPQFNLSPIQVGALSATAFIGAAIGLLIFGKITDKFGRRTIFMVNLAFFIIASALSAFVPAGQIWLLFVTRFVIGFAVGMDIPVSQAYLAEISPNTHRGRMAGSLPNIMWLLGAVLSVLFAMLFNWLAPETAWRWLFGIAAIPAFVIFLLRHLLPESPRWLLEHGRTEDGLKVFKLLDLDPKPAMDAIAERERNKQVKVHITGTMVRRLVAITLFFGFQSFAGAIATVSGPLVLGALNFPRELTLLWSLIGFTLGLVAVIVGAAIIDRVDRRKLGMVTVSLLFVVAMLIAIFGDKSAAFLVVMYFVFSFLTWFGPGVLAWVWSSEAMPTALRGVGAGIAQAGTRVMIALNVFLLPYLQDKIGFKVVGIYGLSYVICFVVVATQTWLSGTGKDLETVDSGVLEDSHAR